METDNSIFLSQNRKNAESANQNSFNSRVWEIVRQISPGNVITYGQIAAMIPPTHNEALHISRAFAARRVGRAMAVCPDDVPWQRVVNAQGRISLGAGAVEQRLLLENEGVEFDAQGRIDLVRFGWK